MGFGEMHSSAIFDARAMLTPSQRLTAAARNMRQARYAANARPDTPIVLRSPIAVIEPQAPIVPANPDEEWIERQKKNPMPPTFKEPWFHIVGESEAPEPKRPRIEQIQMAVAHHYGVSRTDILSARRPANIVRPRQVAMFLAKELTLRSLPEIGRKFGRDHTTALHAIRKIKRLVSQDFQLSATVDAIKASLTEGPV